MAIFKFLVLAGPRSNILERPNSSIVVTTEDLVFTKARLFDERPSQQFRFVTPVVANEKITVDITHIDDGIFALWTNSTTPTKWTKVISGTGAVTQIVDGSDFLARLTNGASGNAEVFQDVVFMSGERVELLKRARTDDAAQPAQLEIQARETGNYLTSDGVTWSSTQQDFKTYADVSMTAGTETFTLESFLQTRLHELTLRIRLHMDGVAATKIHDWDDVQAYPFVNLASIHGHNLLPRIGVELRSSTDNFSGSDDLRATFVVTEPSFFAHLDPEIAARFWRIATTGTSDDAIRFGQWVLGRALGLAEAPDQQGFQITEVQPQRESRAVHTGELWRNNITDLENRNFQVAFRWKDSELVEFRNEVQRRTQRGLSPMVICSENPASMLAVHGRGPSQWQYSLRAFQIQEGSFLFVESPFGASVP